MGSSLGSFCRPSQPPPPRPPPWGAASCRADNGSEATAVCRVGSLVHSDRQRRRDDSRAPPSPDGKRRNAACHRRRPACAPARPSRIRQGTNFATNSILHRQRRRRCRYYRRYYRAATYPPPSCLVVCRCCQQRHNKHQWRRPSQLRLRRRIPSVMPSLLPRAPLLHPKSRRPRPKALSTSTTPPLSLRLRYLPSSCHRRRHNPRPPRPPAW